MIPVIIADVSRHNLVYLQIAMQTETTLTVNKALRTPLIKSICIRGDIATTKKCFWNCNANRTSSSGGSQEIISSVGKIAKKSLICLKGNSMTPHEGNIILFRSSQQLPCLCLLEGLLEVTQRPSRALDSPRALLAELQRIKDTVGCAALGKKAPGHPLE